MRRFARSCAEDLFVGSLAMLLVLVSALVAGGLIWLWAWGLALLLMPLFGFDEGLQQSIALWCGVVGGVLVGVIVLGHNIRRQSSVTSSR
jgi:hypothetical protein